MTEQTDIIQPWFDLRSALPRALGNTLVFWADNGVAHDPAMTHEEWTATLRRHGEALLAYAADDDNEALLGPAKDAIHWVADNLPGMWD